MMTKAQASFVWRAWQRARHGTHHAVHLWMKVRLANMNGCRWRSRTKNASNAVMCVQMVRWPSIQLIRSLAGYSMHTGSISRPFTHFAWSWAVSRVTRSPIGCGHVSQRNRRPAIASGTQTAFAGERSTPWECLNGRLTRPRHCASRFATTRMRLRATTLTMYGSSHAHDASASNPMKRYWHRRLTRADSTAVSVKATYAKRQEMCDTPDLFHSTGWYVLKLFVDWLSGRND